MRKREDWEERLNHARACRDALIVCGNKAPEKPDPPGSLRLVQARTFNGRVFFAEIGRLGHDAAQFDLCKCCRRG